MTAVFRSVLVVLMAWAGHADPLHRGPYLRVSNGKDPAYRIPLAGNPVLP